MIDNFSLVLTHGLLLLIAWRLLFRADLDREPPADTSHDGGDAPPEKPKRPRFRA